MKGENRMDIKKLNTRNSAMDIIRIVAVFTVISVHFFLHNGFYSQTVKGTEMYIMVLMRTFFSVCVPLFIILTGYLMSSKTLSKKYYSGIVKTLIVFVLATIVCMVFKTIKYGDPFTIKDFILNTLNFKGANYSWYIEMYIGLFLIIPFLNLAYNNLKDKKQKQILVLTMIGITILPTALNIFNFENAARWLDPKSSDNFSALIPDWWIGFYPITYYFKGCYLKEYGLKLKTRTLFFGLLLTILLFGSFNFYRSYDTTFKSGVYVYWYGFEPYVLSTILFALLSRLKTEKYKPSVKFALWKLSDLALGIYLLSYVFDVIVYEKLNKAVPVMLDRLPYYFVTVPIVFVCAAISSAILNFLAKYIQIIFASLIKFIKSQKEKANKLKNQDYLFIALIAGAIIFAFWKCAYGFGGNDEAFYLTVPHRLTMGDAFIKDEWHLSQLSGFLLMPFVWLYTTITQSTDGIIYAARILYVIFHSTVSIVIYTRLRKYGYVAMFASVLYFIFTPYDIMAMSYNTMGLDLVALTGVLMGTSSYKKKIHLAIYGVLFAAAVLCSPYLAFAYILFGIGILIHCIIKNKNSNNIFKNELFAPKTFLFFSIGIFALAAVFLVFALSRASISEIIEYFPHLLTDPEHPSISLGVRFKMYFKSIYNCQENFKIPLIAYIATLIIMAFDRKRKNHRSIYLITTVAIVILSFILFIPKLTYSYFNAIMFPMLFIGVTSYILCDKKPKTLFASLFVLGIIYSFALCFSSNQYFYIISMAMSATNIASFIFLAQLLKEMKETEEDITYAEWLKRISFGAVAFMIIMQGSMQIYAKANHCFWEAKTSELNTKISSGPAMGIYTNQSNCNTYETISNDLNYYNDKERDEILFLTAKTWCYLRAGDYPYGTLSAWISGEKPSSIERLKVYYSVNPEKKPTYIYIPKSSEWDLSNIHAEASNYGYTVNENSVSYKLEKV